MRCQADKDNKGDGMCRETEEGEEDGLDTAEGWDGDLGWQVGRDTADLRLRTDEKQ